MDVGGSLPLGLGTGYDETPGSGGSIEMVTRSGPGEPEENLGARGVVGDVDMSGEVVRNWESCLPILGPLRENPRPPYIPTPPGESP